MVENTGQPKYLQLADELRRKITDGTYGVGAELPSTAQLTSAYDVSTTVVRAAMRELRGEGIIVGQPGKAVYVTGLPTERPSGGDLVDVRKQLAELSESVNDAIKKLDARVAKLERKAKS